LLGALLILVAFVIFPLSYTLFTLFYALYGTVLYVVGPRQPLSTSKERQLPFDFQIPSEGV
jgi:hypothetical protein